MGRPPLPAPDDFAETFVTHGWEAKDILNMDTPRFKRSLTAFGDDLKRRRKNYVLGRRLSSLKVGARQV
jgi:hypothetical protein